MSGAGLSQVSAAFGACTAGEAYIPALGDEVITVRGAGRIHFFTGLAHPSGMFSSKGSSHVRSGGTDARFTGRFQ